MTRFQLVHSKAQDRRLRASGRLLKQMSPDTPVIRVNGITFAVTPAQYKLYQQAIRGCGIYVTRAEVRSARKLEALGAGTLTDSGALGSFGNQDGERFYFVAAESREEA